MKPASSTFNPHGLKVLLVDPDPTSLVILQKMLRSCGYQVTPCSQPTEALSFIRNEKLKLDIVITEVNLSPHINGIQFLEIVVGETNLPVVVVSSDDRINTIIRCVTKGACDYLPKPVRMEVVKLLWQHAARKNIKQISNEPGSSKSGEFCGSSAVEGPVQHKKQRLVWTDGLHQKFVDAVKQLGIHNAVPKKVLEMMNVPGLRRENVASHLQKYRLNLRKQTSQLPNSNDDTFFQTREIPVDYPLIFPFHQHEYHFKLHEDI